MEPRRLSWVFLLGFSGRNVVVLRHHDYRWVSRTRTRDSFQLTARDDKYILRISLGCFNFFFHLAACFNSFFLHLIAASKGHHLTPIRVWIPERTLFQGKGNIFLVSSRSISIIVIKPVYEFSGSFNLNFDICSLLLAFEQRDIFKQNVLQSFTVEKFFLAYFLPVSISDVRSLVTWNI